MCCILSGKLWQIMFLLDLRLRKFRKEYYSWELRAPARSLIIEELELPVSRMQDNIIYLTGIWFITLITFDKKNKAITRGFMSSEGEKFTGRYDLYDYVLNNDDILNDTRKRNEFIEKVRATFGVKDFAVYTKEGNLQVASREDFNAIRNSSQFNSCLQGDISPRSIINYTTKKADNIYIPIYNKDEVVAVLYLECDGSNGNGFTGKEAEEIQDIFQPVFVYQMINASMGSEVVSGFMGIIGMSEAMKRVYKKIILYSQYDEPVLICGDTGTGKDLVASAIHRFSQRSHNKFNPQNCAAIAEGISDTILFGHIKGIFTDAKESRSGIFEDTEGGTLFLDEIGDLDKKLQTKLLRVLDTKKVIRMGEHEERETDFRAVFATNKNLEEMVKDGSFRQDFYYRISALRIDVPSLQERKEDIPLIAKSIIESFCRQYQKVMDAEPLTESAKTILMNHNWTGNVRELINVINRSLIEHRSKKQLDAADIVFSVRSGALSPIADIESFFNQDHKLDDVIYTYTKKVYRRYNEDRIKTASTLGISLFYLKNILKPESLFRKNKEKNELPQEIDLL